MLPLPEYKSHNHVKFLLNYHFVFIPKRRKKVLVDKVATRTRQIFLELAIEKEWDILALEVAPDHVHILVDGRIVASGGMELAAQLEASGYEAFR